MRMMADRNGFGWCEGGKRILAYLSGKLLSRILVYQTSLMVNESESFGVKGALQNLPSDNSNALIYDSSDEEVTANCLLKFSLDS
ncbi:hypothetical protein TNCV_3085641 [Trichonephila clavipes]|nr:hypothetical protein TNCV_3085641 [Trichonephila clavipes]